MRLNIQNPFTSISSNFAIFLGLLILISGCSNQEIYQAVQNNRLQECDKLPDVQREECRAQHSQPYEEYERNRKELENK